MLPRHQLLPPLAPAAILILALPLCSGCLSMFVQESVIPHGRNLTVVRVEHAYVEEDRRLVLLMWLYSSDARSESAYQATLDLDQARAAKRDRLAKCEPDQPRHAIPLPANWSVVSEWPPQLTVPTPPRRAISVQHWTRRARSPPGAVVGEPATEFAAVACGTHDLEVCYVRTDSATAATEILWTVHEDAFYQPRRLWPGLLFPAAVAGDIALTPVYLLLAVAVIIAMSN